jgi:hypothetical protein
MKMRWVGHVARKGKGRSIYRFSVGRPEGMRPLRRSRLRWYDNIKIDVWKTGIDGSNWIQLAQDRAQWWGFVSTEMKLQIP